MLGIYIFKYIHIFKPCNGTKAHWNITYCILPHSFLTSVLDGGEWSTSLSGHLKPTEVSRYPNNKKQCGPGAGLDLWRSEKFFLLPRFEPRILHPSHCTDQAIPAQLIVIVVIIYY